jgi:hypothetical protein
MGGGDGVGGVSAIAQRRWWWRWQLGGGVVGVPVWRRPGSGGSLAAGVSACRQWQKHGGSSGSLAVAAAAVAEALRCRLGIVVATAAAAWWQRQFGGGVVAAPWRWQLCGSLVVAAAWHWRGGRGSLTAASCGRGAVVAAVGVVAV